MTNPVTDLLAFSPATPGQLPGATPIDGAATGSFAGLLSDAALQPDTLSGVLEPDAAQLAPTDGQPLLLVLPQALAATEAAMAGNNGQPLPHDGNGLPLAPELAAVVDGAGDSLVDPALVINGPVAAADGVDQIAALAEDVDSLVAPETDTPIAAAAVATQAEVPVLHAADIARSAAIPSALAESTPRSARPDVVAADRPIPVTTTPASLADAVAPATLDEALARPAVAAAEVAVADVVARPEAVTRTAATDVSPGTAGQDLLARIAPLDTAATRAPVLETPTRMVLDQPLTSPGWSEALGKRVLVMTDTQVRSAEIRMDPPELGPIEVQLTVKDDKAHVAFQAQHALTRDAIESALPRLREMLAEQGLALGQTTVSDQSAGESRGSRQDGSDQSFANDSGSGEIDDIAPTHRVAAHVGLIDEYA